MAERDAPALTRRAALLAAGALSACAARPEPAPLPAVPQPNETELGRLLGRSPGLTVGGEPLDAVALRGFYARRGFRQVWARQPDKAEALVTAVLNAGDHGLDPEMFHGTLLQRREDFPALRRELLLSDAFLAYAAALAHGGVPSLRRTPFEALVPQNVDIAGALHDAIASEDPAARLEALAPATPTYEALRRAMKDRPPRPRAAAAAFAARQRSIEANLERERWLPRRLPADRVWVNVPDQQLTVFRGDEPVFRTRVVVGDNAERNQTPEFTTKIEAGFFNPPWVIPRDIVEAEILPRLEREPDYLARNRMVLRANGEIEQTAGPEAGLGFVLFDMPNRFDVYLHDTPDRFVFSRSNRRMSRGCIRVENPRQLAAILMDEPIEVIDTRIAGGETVRKTLPTPVPVYLIYQTAFADAAGRLQFREDFYGRDVPLWQRLRKHMPVVEPEPPVVAARTAQRRILPPVRR